MSFTDLFSNPSMFWADRPVGPGSLSELQARRRIAQAMLARKSGYPKNAGEGLTSLGEGIADAATMTDIARREAAYNKAVEGEVKKAYPTQTSDTEPTETDQPPTRTAERPTDEAPVRTAALTSPAAEEAPANRNTLVSEMIRQPSQLPPAGPVGNAPNTFGPSIVNAATGSRRDLPTQPSPNRFSSEFGRLAAVPTARVNPLDAIGTAMMSPERTMNDVPALGYSEEGPSDPFVPRSMARAGPMPDLGAGPAGPAPRVRLAALGIPTDIPPAPASAAAAIGAGPAAGQRFDEAFNALPPAPAPTQLAQAGPAATPPYTPVVPRQPVEDVELYPKNPIQPPQTPRSPREIEALRRMAMFPDDENIRRIWEPVLQNEQAQRLYKDKLNGQLYAKQLEMLATQKAANQVASRAEPANRVEQLQKEQTLPTPAPTGQATPGIVDTRWGRYDTRLGTVASPQRIGVPTAEPVPAGVPPGIWAQSQARKIEADMQIGEKAGPTFRRMTQHIQEILDNPAVKDGSALGLIGKAKSLLPNTEAGALAARIDQVKNQAFLNVYQDYFKGAGAGSFSNIEGTKATAAQARVNQATSPREFRAAMQDLNDAIREDYETIQRRLNQPVTAWKMRPEDPIAPDKGQIQTNFADGIPRRYLGGNPLDYDHSWEKLR